MKRRNFIKTGLGSLAGMHVLFLPAATRTSSRSRYSAMLEDPDVIVKVLGTAQDGGIPHIGCYCPNCQRARKKPDCIRLKPSIAICDLKEKKAFVVDASPDIGPQFDMIHSRMGYASEEKINTPHGILLTHAHIGHYTGLMFYGYEGLNSTQIPVYCTARMARFLEENGPWSQMVRYENIAIQTLRPDTEVKLTPQISFIPILVPHRDEYSDTIGLIVQSENKKLLYIPDIQSWEAWDRSIKKEVERVDCAILDGTFYSPDELPGRDLSKIGHPFITASMELLSPLAKAGRIKIYFSHLNHTNLAL
ncbi:MAG: pyrroloquinoline quinone biosynthesis protein PqqB, partial [Candidatus Aminicenantes bacterium]|nr:pyrroloquinoline quinone biosynthesis protein PqqB [Candidatus Aminicenantes bacterium]